MKKNFSVNIGGRIFNIDDDAYECLNSYLNRLRNFFAAEQGYTEIIADIEMRIAELLDQQKENGNPVITLKHIEDVIASMANPTSFRIRIRNNRVWNQALKHAENCTAIPTTGKSAV